MYVCMHAGSRSLVPGGGERIHYSARLGCAYPHIFLDVDTLEPDFADAPLAVFRSSAVVGAAVG